MQFRKKLIYIWDYYKFHILGVIVVIILLVQLIMHFLNSENVLLNVAFVNFNPSETLCQDLTDPLRVSEDASRNDSIQYYGNLYLTEDTSDPKYEYVQPSEIKITSLINEQQLDIALCDEKSFYAFATQGYLASLSDFIGSLPDLQEELKPYLAGAETPSGSLPVGLIVNKLGAFSSYDMNENLYLCVLANTPNTQQAAYYIKSLSYTSLPQ